MEQLLIAELSVSSNAVVVTATGEVDMTTADLLAEGMSRAHELIPSPRAVIAELSGVRFPAAADVAVLVASHRACRRRGVPLWVVASNRAVRRPLDLCDLTSVLNVMAESPATTITRLAGELESRAPVDTAVGVLMADVHVDENHARTMLADQARLNDISVPEHALKVMSRTDAQATADFTDTTPFERSKQAVLPVAATGRPKSS